MVTWTATIQRIDQAKQVAADAQAADAQAARSTAQLAHVEAQTPKRRERAQWRQTLDEARAERDAAVLRAQELADAAAQAASGLPESLRWDAMREHATAGLHDAAARREQAIIDDQRDRDQAARDIPVLARQTEALRGPRDHLRAEAARREAGEAPQSTRLVRDVDEPRHDIERDRGHEHP